MKPVLLVVAMCLSASAAFAQESTAAGDKPPADDRITDKIALKVADTAAKPDETDKEFKPPPGFKTKKRGKLVLYCMRDSTVGTRFHTEKCYDEAQLRDYLIAREENKRDIDRVRSTCSSGVAGGPCVHP
jgi:hypothetical protein